MRFMENVRINNRTLKKGITKFYLRIVFSILVFLIFSGATAFGQIYNGWQLFETTHPSDKQLVALHINTAANTEVDNTGASDVTSEFQQAIDYVFNNGGGSIYVPEGRYRFDGTIVIKEGVNLRGDFTVPEGTSVSGSILEPGSGRNNQGSEPFITLRGSATIDGFTIWYPEQDAAAIVPYPSTILFQRNEDGRYPKHASRARCINLVNSYFGIDIGVINTALPMVINIYGSPLYKGIRINECSDVSRIIDIHFSPDYWANSGLAGAPSKNGPHSTFMYEQGHAIDYLRSDNGFNGFWYISGYNKGLSINSGFSAGPFYEFEITNCKEALILKTINQVPATFTSCIFEGSNAALVQEQMTGAAQFNSSVFRSNNLAVKPASSSSNSAAQVSFQDCVFDAPVQLTGLMTSVANSTFAFEGNHVTLDKALKNAILMDNTYQGGRSISNNMSKKENALIRDTTKAYLSTPEFEYIPFISHAPTRAALYIATDFDGVVEGDNIDDGPGIQLALNKAAEDDGGIVFLPAGEYILNSPITIPSNVELRGVLDMPHHGRLPLNKDLEHEFGTFFFVKHNRGNPTGATITISANAGVRGISAYYPEQDIHITGSARPFPWLFSLNGENIYIKNVLAVNPYQFLDISSAKCDNHYIENNYIFPLKTGIQIGKGSSGGKLRNVHYNGTVIGQAFYPTDSEKLNNWNHANMESFKFGDIKNEEMLFCFTRMCKAGIVLSGEEGVGPNGLSIGFGVESITKGACLDVTGNNGFKFINASLLAENNTINFESSDTLELYNSRTKQSQHFIKSSSQIGRLVFNQVLHRGDNTTIQFQAGEVEIVNGLFYDSLNIELTNPDIALRIYGGFLKNGALQTNVQTNEIFWDYIPDMYSADPIIKFNPDLFLFPGDLVTDVKDFLSEQNSEIKMYPNPAKDILNINWTKEGEMQVRIYDIAGSLVYLQKTYGSEMTIPVNLIGKPGIYLIKINGLNLNEGKLLSIH
jgi:hypothetical protein